MLRTGLGALALMFATGAGAAQDTRAGAAQDNVEFRVIGSHDGGIAMVSPASGPQTARRLTEVIILQQRAPGGGDAYSADFKIDCGKGALAFGNIVVYKDNAVLERYPDEPDEQETPSKGSISWDIVQYACTGAVLTNETVRVNGVLPAIAYGRKRLGPIN